MSTISQEKDAPPAVLRQLAEDWLTAQADYSRSLTALLDGRSCASCAALEQPKCFCPIPDEWIDALAREFQAALEDRGREWLEVRKADKAAIERCQYCDRETLEKLCPRCGSEMVCFLCGSCGTDDCGYVMEREEMEALS